MNRPFLFVLITPGLQNKTRPTTDRSAHVHETCVTRSRWSMFSRRVLIPYRAAWRRPPRP